MRGATGKRKGQPEQCFLRGGLSAIASRSPLKLATPPGPHDGATDILALCDRILDNHDLTGVASRDLAPLRSHLSTRIDGLSGDRAQFALTLQGEVDRELRRRSRSIKVRAAVNGRRASERPDDPVVREFDDETAQRESLLRARHEQTLREFDKRWAAHVGVVWDEYERAREGVIKRIRAEARAFCQSRAKQRDSLVARATGIITTATEALPRRPGRSKAPPEPVKDQPTILPPLFNTRAACAKAVYRQKLVDLATQTDDVPSDDEEEEGEWAVVRETPKVHLVGVALVVESFGDEDSDDGATLQRMAREGRTGDGQEEPEPEPEVEVEVDVEVEVEEVQRLEGGEVTEPVGEADANEQMERSGEAEIPRGAEMADDAERTGEAGVAGDSERAGQEEPREDTGRPGEAERPDDAEQKEDVDPSDDTRVPGEASFLPRPFIVSATADRAGRTHRR